jgi:DNA invertase Pin-like site-specific DNA recombinase
MNKKVLIMVRTSTEQQSIDDQHREMVEFCKQQGYKEDDMIFMEEQGASAAKMDSKYLDLINRIKAEIEKNKDIKCFACWHLNRAFRTEEAYIDIKTFLVNRGIQMMVKNPYLVLLNDDGTINNGMEMAMALFAVLNKQDNLERKAKFKRAKAEMARKGMYTGGRNAMKFGYKVDENKYFIPDEVESEIVRLIFQLYSTGEYSTYSLANEINSRGYTKRGKPFDGTFIGTLLKSKSYTGQPDEKWNDRVYPPIISEEIFNQCRDIADKNKLMLRQGKKMVLCSRLLKCTECNHAFVSASKHFRCNGADKGLCTNNITLKESVVDLVAWRIAFDEHMKYLIEVSENNTQAYNERLEVIDQKINTINGIIAESSTKKKRIVDTYLEGYIDKKERDLRLSKLQDDILVHQKDLSALEEEKSAILGLLENVNKEKDEWLYYDTLDTMQSGVKSDEDRYRIIHQHILKIIPLRHQHGKKGPRAKKENAIMLEIYTVKGDIHKVIYLPKEQKGDNLLTFHNDKGIWLGERI